MKTNYHTHTYRCHHATGDVDDYVKCAIDAGIDILGISDHTPLPNDKWPEDRMTLKEFEEYDIRAICNSDAHAPEHVSNFAESEKMAKRLGLEICEKL